MDADRTDPVPGGSPDSGPGRPVDWKQVPDLGRAALDRLAERLARLPGSHPSSPDYQPAGRDTARNREAGSSGGWGESGAGALDGITGAVTRGDAAVDQAGAGGAAARDAGGAGEPGGSAGAAGGDGGTGASRGRPPRAWPRQRGDGRPEGQEPANPGRPGGRDGPSLLDRLPRLGGLAARPGSSGRSQPGRMDLGRLGPRPPAGPYRPWFTGSPDEPWFGGSADDPWFTRSNDP